MDVEQAREALGLGRGDPYVPPRLETARRQLNAAYRRLGFNSTRIGMRPTVQRSEGLVDIRVDVAEGPQQVLQDIQVTGAIRTRPGLVSRALDLTLGEPVDLTAWNRARRRLYDMNVFRRADLEIEPLTSDPADRDQVVQPVRARVSLEEWPRYRLRYGLQLLDE
jgi:outer membrane protein assembly factor BamA